MQYAGVKELKDLPEELMDQLERFFENYNKQAGKIFRPLKRLTALQALTSVEKARDEAKKNTLIQLFIPLFDEKGNQFPDQYYTKLNFELKERFGGVTIYNRCPVTGLWKEDEEKTAQDQLLVYEVLINTIENDYWQGIKSRLEKQFKQAELLVLMTKIHKL